MRIDLISAALPPLLDGIGDYTACLAAELVRSPGVDRVRIWTGISGDPPAPIPGVVVRPTFDPSLARTTALLDQLISEDPPDWVVLQYNPFSYGKWGLNLHLPASFQRLRQRSDGVRLALMIHEPFVPAINPKFAVMAIWQRLQLWQLGRAADVVFCSIQPWADRFSRWFPRQRPQHLPVGSALPRVSADPAVVRQQLGIGRDELVLGVFGTAHAGRLLHWVGDAARTLAEAGREVRVLYLGPDAARLREIVPAQQLVAPGRLPAAEVSACLLAVDLYLAPFIDGVSTRRTSVMAALQHGLPVLGTSGPLTDAVLHAANGTGLRMVTSSDPTAFQDQVKRLTGDCAARRQLGCGGEQLFQRHFTWERIARTLIARLGETPA